MYILFVYYYLSLFWVEIYSLIVLSRSSSVPLCAAVPLIILLNLHVEPKIGGVIGNSPHQFQPLNFLKKKTTEIKYYTTS